MQDRTTARVTFRLDSDLKASLLELARQDGRSLNSLLCKLARDAISSNNKDLTR